MSCKQFRDPLRTRTLRLITNEVGLQTAQNEEGSVRVQCAAQCAEVGAQPANEIAAADHRSAHDIAGAGSILRQTMHEHIDIVLTVLMEARERVIHDGESARGAREPGERGDVRNLGNRIRGTLEEYEPRWNGGEGALDARDVLDRQHRMSDPKP